MAVGAIRGYCKSIMRSLRKGLARVPASASSPRVFDPSSLVAEFFSRCRKDPLSQTFQYLSVATYVRDARRALGKKVSRRDLAFMAMRMAGGERSPQACPDHSWCICFGQRQHTGMSLEVIHRSISKQFTPDFVWTCLVFNAFPEHL